MHPVYMHRVITRWSRPVHPLSGRVILYLLSVTCRYGEGGRRHDLCEVSRGGGDSAVLLANFANYLSILMDTNYLSDPGMGGRHSTTYSSCPRTKSRNVQLPRIALAKPLRHRSMDPPSTARIIREGNGMATTTSRGPVPASLRNPVPVSQSLAGWGLAATEYLRCMYKAVVHVLCTG